MKKQHTTPTIINDETTHDTNNEIFNKISVIRVKRTFH